MSKITYALPAFAGHLTSDDRNMINAISRKAFRRGVTHMRSTLQKSSTNLIANSSLRSSILVIVYITSKTPAHCRYSLRERQHSFQLSNIEFLQFKNSFINRCLFKFRWLHSALHSDVFSEFCAYCSYCSFNSTFYFVYSWFYVLLLNSIL